jgi:hypothetical protein
LNEGGFPSLGSASFSSSGMYGIGTGNPALYDYLSPLWVIELGSCLIKGLLPTVVTGLFA